MPDDLILVDIFDKPIGSASKSEAHRLGRLHRAFSVFLHDGERMLIQQRHFEKYHSGGLWANACCSHPRDGETLADAVNRRMQEKLGVTCPVSELGTFVYRHCYSPELAEYEFDHVFMGRFSGEVSPDPAEIADWRWIPYADLAADLIRNPDAYTVWFHTAAPMVLAALRDAQPDRTD